MTFVRNKTKNGLMAVLVPPRSRRSDWSRWAASDTLQARQAVCRSTGPKAPSLIGQVVKTRGSSSRARRRPRGRAEVLTRNKGRLRSRVAYYCLATSRGHVPLSLNYQPIKHHPPRSKGARVASTPPQLGCAIFIRSTVPPWSYLSWGARSSSMWWMVLPAESCRRHLRRLLPGP